MNKENFKKVLKDVSLVVFSLKLGFMIATFDYRKREIKRCIMHELELESKNNVIDILKEKCINDEIIKSEKEEV
jgi:regulatory protein YycH of two-component signal transduction system YycFG